MIDKQKLKEKILSNRTRVYCVLDGAAIPNLPKRLYEMKPPNYPLISGKLTPDMIHVAPYLVQLKPGNKFSGWILDEGFGKNWGIFAHTRSPKIEMRRHFHSLMTVHSDDGTPMLFRFYDPRVFRKFLPTCDQEQIEILFGSVDEFFVEAETGDSLLTYKVENKELKQREADIAVKE